MLNLFSFYIIFSDTYSGMLWLHLLYKNNTFYILYILTTWFFCQTEWLDPVTVEQLIVHESYPLD